MIVVDEAAWTAAGVLWQKDREFYRFLVTGRTEAPTARAIEKDGKTVLDLQLKQSSSHRALEKFLKQAMGVDEA